MLKEQFDNLSPEQRCMVSVAYLMSNPDKQPEETKKLFDKLNVYDRNARNIQSAIEQAKKSINELQPKLEQIIGAITAISSVVAEMIPVDQAEEYCMAYNLPNGTNQETPVLEGKPSNVVDFAGTTAKSLPNPKK